jgi:TRAP-type mannitol/chloroaromatic compound transport system permease small subunit
MDTSTQALAWKIKETSWSSPAQIQIYMVKSMIPAAGTFINYSRALVKVCRSIICIKKVNGQQGWL